MPTPTYNKYKSTTIYGNLSVRDLTNSAGNTVIEVASVDLSGNFISRGDSTFTKKVICNASVADINANNILTTKEYVDTAVSTGGSVSLSGTNAFTGNNSYNTNFPTSTLPTSTSITNDSIVNKGMNDTLYSLVANQVKTNTANAFTSTNSFNSNLPTSSLGAGAISGTEQFLTKGLMDNIYARKANVNNWTSENTFDSYLPTSTITPTSASQLTTKTFVDGAISTAVSGLSSVYQTISGMSSYLTTATASSTYQTISGMSSYLTTATASSTYSTLTNEVKTNTANAFTSTNTFNSNFPTSTLPTSTAVTNDSIPNKGKNDTLYSLVANQVKTNTANAFTSTNTFNSNFPTSTLPTSTSITNDSIVNKGMNDTLYSLVANQVKTNTANAFTSTNTFNSNFPTSTLPTSTTITTSSIVNKGMNDTLYGSKASANTFSSTNEFTNSVKFTGLVEHTANRITQFRSIPSGVQNEFISTSFLEAVTFGKGFNQDGTDTNLIHNLTLSLGNLTMETGRVNLPTDEVDTPATSANQLGHRINGSFSTSAISSATATSLSQITLPFGIYIVVANIVFQSNATTGNISKYQIGFNNAGGTAITSSTNGYGGNANLATSASNTTQLSLTATEVVSITDASKTFRVVANITYATTTISINTTLSKFTAVRIA